MISNQVIQKTLDKIKIITGADLAVLGLNGAVIVRTFTDEDIDADRVSSFAASSNDEDDIGGYRLFKVREDSRDEFLLAVRKSGRDEKLIGAMARFQIETLLIAYKERFDRDNFFKSLLMDNMLMIDIFDRAKKLHIDTEAYRAVLIIDTENRRHSDVVEAVRTIFMNSSEDFVTAINRKDVIAIKRVDSASSYAQLENVASKIEAAVSRDGKGIVRISYGTIVADLKEVSMSYKEARMAMDVSRIFFEERSINPYNRLDIGRLIYQLPMPLCRLFIDETFSGINIEDMDDETLTTINKFFENSLNVSETSRQLYIHRNTLVYRLDKIQKITGLDLRIFEDAITFKIALMVSRYMKFMENKK